MRDVPMDEATLRWKQIEKFLETYEFIMNADVRLMYGVSSATANRILAGFTTKRKLVKCREDEH